VQFARLVIHVLSLDHEACASFDTVAIVTQNERAGIKVSGLGETIRVRVLLEKETGACACDVAIMW
jgi:hypothetical protein